MKSDHLLFRSMQHSAGGIDYRHVPTTLFPLAAFTSPQPLHHQALPSPTPFITIICLKEKKNPLHCNGTNWIYGVMESGHNSKSVQGENFQQGTPEHTWTPTQSPPPIPHWGVLIFRRTHTKCLITTSALVLVISFIFVSIIRSVKS